MTERPSRARRHPWEIAGPPRRGGRGGVHRTPGAPSCRCGRRRETAKTPNACRDARTERPARARPPRTPEPGSPGAPVARGRDPTGIQTHNRAHRFALMRPNVPASRLVAGLPQLKLFSRLNTSMRSSSSAGSRTGRARQRQIDRPEAGSLDAVRCGGCRACPLRDRQTRPGSGIVQRLVADRRVVPDLVHALAAMPVPCDVAPGASPSASFPTRVEDPRDSASPTPARSAALPNSGVWAPSVTLPMCVRSANSCRDRTRGLFGSSSRSQTGRSCRSRRCPLCNRDRVVAAEAQAVVGAAG